MKLIYTGYTTDSNTVLSFKKRQAKQLCVYGSGGHTSGGTFENAIYETTLSTGETTWETSTIEWGDFGQASEYEENVYEDKDTYISGDTGSGGGTDEGWKDKGNIIPLKELCEIKTNFTNCQWDGLLFSAIVKGRTLTGALVPDEGYEFSSESSYGISCIGKSGNSIDITVRLNDNGYATVKIENVQENLTISCTCIASS